jgi:outer membrane protein assembly factor BamA
VKVLINHNHRVFFLFVVLTIHAFQFSVAQKSITVISNEKIEPCKKCNKILKINSSKNNLDSIISNYINCIRNYGYLAASADSTRLKNDSVLVYIFQGTKYKWGNINFEFKNNEWAPSSTPNFHKLAGKPVNYNTFSRLKNNILISYENTGYPFVSIASDSIELQPGVLSLNCIIKNGDLITFDSLDITGTKKISGNYFSHYLGIVPKKNYQEKKIREISKRIKELSFLSESKSAEIFFIEKKAKVRLYLKDKKANQFNGILGLMPDNQKPGHYFLTGDITLNLSNSFKHGDQIDFSWKKLETSSQNLTATVQWPYLLNKPIGLSGSLKLYKKDSTYVNVASKIGVPFFLTGSNTLSFYYENCSSTLLSSTGFSALTRLPSVQGYNVNMFGIQLWYSNLDYKFNPRKGFQVKFLAAYGKKTIEKHPKINTELYNGVQLNSFRNELSGDFIGYLPVYKKLAIKFRGQVGYINSHNTLQNELYRIGGLASLRGFDEESIYASVYGIGTSELRFLFEQNSAFFVFYDLASYQNLDHQVDNPSGFGAGIEFQTGAGIFSLTYALGRQFNNPIEFRNARIHFGFINRF